MSRPEEPGMFLGVAVAAVVGAIAVLLRRKSDTTLHVTQVDDDWFYSQVPDGMSHEDVDRYIRERSEREDD